MSSTNQKTAIKWQVSIIIDHLKQLPLEYIPFITQEAPYVQVSLKVTLNKEDYWEKSITRWSVTAPFFYNTFQLKISHIPNELVLNIYK